MLRFNMILVLLVLYCASDLQAAPKRNVLLLISDNQNWNDLGCYGNPVVKTPHLDRLAKHSVQFSYAFATTASCGPSRAVIYTGMQTHNNGQYGHGHGIHTFRLKPGIQTVFQLLVKNGYRTALLGKQHVMPESAYPFTFNPKTNGRDVLGMAQAGKEFINASDEPFLLVIGYRDPHPTSRDRPGWGIKKSYDGVPEVAYDPQKINVPDYLPDRPEVREGLAGYYQQISRMDFGVGAILQALQESGKADETLVIFTSDHGSSEPGAMATHYEPGVRVPFLVHNPLLKKQGLQNKALITFLDIVPTILDWTDTPKPKGYRLPGRSLLPILSEHKADGWDEVYLSHVCHEATMYYPMRTIRTRRFKLIWNIDWRSEYPLPIDTLQRATWQESLKRGDRIIGKRTVKKFLLRDEIELYDLQSDPDEIINLAENPNYSTIKTELTNKLFAHLKQTEDPWLTRHDLPGSETDQRSAAWLHRQRIDDEQGYQPLFNGKNLDGWKLRRADRKDYLVEQGHLVCPADGGGFLFTEKQYADFSLRFEFKLTKGANNGIAIRTPLVDSKPAYEGMEIQILDNVGYPRKLKPTQYHGSLYDVAPAKQGALKPVGEWNSQEIICQGRQITVIVNEMPILNVDLDNIKNPELLTKHPGLKRKRGHIGLLGHGSRVEFNNIRIKEL